MHLFNAERGGKSPSEMILSDRTKAAMERKLEELDGLSESAKSSLYPADGEFLAAYNSLGRAVYKNRSQDILIGAKEIG